MRCNRVHELLEEYARNELPGRESSIVKLHLETCTSCREHYNFIRKYLEEVKTMPKYGAPDDFIESLNRRINENNSSFSLRKFFDIMFSPWKIKLPLEAAALLVIGTIVTAIYYQAPEQHHIAKEDSGKAYHVAENIKSKAPVESVPHEKAEKKVDKLQPVTIQLALLVHQDKQEMMDLYSSRSSNTSMSAPVKRRAAAADMQEESVEGEKEQLSEKPGVEQAVSLDQVISDIEAVVYRLDGKVLYKQVNKDTGSIDLHVSIPTHRSNEFIQNLSIYGSLEDTPAMPVHEKPGKITFKIRIK